MRLAAGLATAVLATTGCAAFEAPPPPRLEKLWVAEGFSAPEGATRAPDGTYFISNVAGGGTDKDGAGWISRIAGDGRVLDARWAEGLDAPKGMAVHDGALFVADIDRVRSFDAATGEPLDVWPIDGAGFLNDVAVWRGAVYVSDSRTARIHRLEEGAWPVWREGEVLGGVNGLLGDRKRLLVATMDEGALLEFDAKGAMRTIATGAVDADGIGLVRGGGVLLSAWRGDIFYVGKDGALTKLLDSRAEGVLQNDLMTDGDLVIVPNWRPGTVTGWRLIRE